MPHINLINTDLELDNEGYLAISKNVIMMDLVNYFYKINKNLLLCLNMNKKFMTITFTHKNFLTTKNLKDEIDYIVTNSIYTFSDTTPIPGWKITFSESGTGLVMQTLGLPVNDLWDILTDFEHLSVHDHFENFKYQIPVTTDLNYFKTMLNLYFGEFKTI